MKLLHPLAFLLVIVGALNWGLVGLFGVNAVSSMFGKVPMLEQAIYISVGVAAVYLILTHQNDCQACTSLMKGKKK